MKLNPFEDGERRPKSCSEGSEGSSFAARSISPMLSRRSSLGSLTGTVTADLRLNENVNPNTFVGSSSKTLAVARSSSLEGVPVKKSAPSNNRRC